MEHTRSGNLRNTMHADSSSGLNSLQQLQGINSGHGGSGSSNVASSTHLMSAPNPFYSNGGSSMANSSNNSNSSTFAKDDRGSWSRKRGSLRAQDRHMPTANVVRIMRRALPGHAKISDDAKEAVQECVSQYISFITGEANDKCQREQRKTITAEDVISAMENLGLDNYAPCLSHYLKRYRENDQLLRTPPTQRTPPPPPMETYFYSAPLPPMVANESSQRFATGPAFPTMNLPWAFTGPSEPNYYGPGFEFQYGPNNSGAFNTMGLSGYDGNTVEDGAAGGSSSQNAMPNFDPSTQLFK